MMRIKNATTRPFWVQDVCNQSVYVRAGFEERVTLVDDSLAKSSADFVTWAVQVARAHGREPATPQEARHLIGIAEPKPPSH